MHLRNSPPFHFDLSQKTLASLGRILLTKVLLRCLIPVLSKWKMDKLRLSLVGYDKAIKRRRICWARAETLVQPYLQSRLLS